MGRDADGKPVPLSTVHVLVDADREIAETVEMNNGTQLPVAEILPVDPAAFEVDLQEATAGGELTLAGEGLGPVPGRVVVHLGGLELDAEILGWYDLGVRFTLPKIPLAAPTEAEVIVIRADGAAANPLKITISAPQPDVAAELVLPGPTLEK